MPLTVPFLACAIAMPITKIREIKTAKTVLVIPHLKMFFLSPSVGAAGVSSLPGPKESFTLVEASLPSDSMK
jgi:hypothetical protein